MNIIRTPREDALGSLLYKFFFQDTGTEENEEELAKILWLAVSRYRKTGEFSFAAIVCPEYSRDYTDILSGTSITALRAINLFKSLKAKIRRHIRFGKDVHFRISVFDREYHKFNLIQASPEKASNCMNGSVKDIALRIRKTGKLPDNFKAERLVGIEYAEEWQRVFNLANECLRSESLGPHAPFDNPNEIFKKLRDFYVKVMNTDDEAVHREMFDAQEAPGYMSAGHFLRRKHGSHTVLIDMGSDKGLSKMTLWQPEGEMLTGHPSLIRIKHPKGFD